MLRDRLILLPACAVGLFCGCSGGPKYPTVSSFCSAQASAECSQEVLLACAIPDESTCVANREQLCLAAVPAASTYESGAAPACIGEIQSAYADAKLTMAESTAITNDCELVFDGMGGLGAVCQSDSDCKGSQGLQCVLGPASAQGTCQVPQLVEGGGVCAAANAQCADGFHCGPTGNCDIDGSLNDPCSATTPCGPGLNCSSVAAAPATCVAKELDGTACTTDDDCLHGICNKSMTMPMATGLCVSEVTLAPDEPFCVDSR
jgi:hypothetical protein